MSDDTPNLPDPPDLQDLVLNLNFVPTWARQPSEQSPYGRDDSTGGSDRRPDREPRRGMDRDRDRDRRPGGGGRRDRRPDRRDDRRGGHRERREAPPARLPLEVSFIPEKAQLGAIVRQLHTTCRAYPLFYIAHLLLAKPEFHLIKIEVRPGAALKLHQCTRDGMIALDADGVRSHVLRTFLSEAYDVRETVGDPPAGHFVCVGRCRLSGELVGPPNYHGFNERVAELHRDRFSHLSLPDYRSQIDMIRDPALIEQWKEQARKQTVYVPKDAAPDAPGMKRGEAEARFWSEHGQKWATTTGRAVLSARLAKDIGDEPLRRAIHEAWLRENRSPFRMAMALRPAFRRMRLHLFKAGANETYVTAIPPHPIEPGRAVENIAAVLRLLEEHPGCTRAQLSEWLCPGQPPDGPESAAALAPLRWLVEKGHVIEFFNGTLSLPARPAPVPPLTAPAPSAATPPAPAVRP